MAERAARKALKGLGISACIAQLATPAVAATLWRVSIADELRLEQAERLRRLEVTARIELAFALGRRDISIYAAANAVTAAEARRKLRAQRQTGRMPSASAGE